MQAFPAYIFTYGRKKCGCYMWVVVNWKNSFPLRISSLIENVIVLRWTSKRTRNQEIRHMQMSYLSISYAEKLLFNLVVFFTSCFMLFQEHLAWYDDRLFPLMDGLLYSNARVISYEILSKVQTIQKKLPDT